MMDDKMSELILNGRLMAMERCFSVIISHICLHLPPESSNHLRSEIADAALNANEKGEWDENLEIAIRTASLDIIRKAEEMEIASREKYRLPLIRRYT